MYSEHPPLPQAGEGGAWLVVLFVDGCPVVWTLAHHPNVATQAS